jgi:spermidine synthase
MSSSFTVYFFSFLLAFCSLFYELVYAEILSVCLGGTKIQYITTIAIFTCALGFGSLSFRKISSYLGLRKTFFTVELLLMLLGALGPFFITWLLQPGGVPALVTVKLLISYSIIFIIGYLSGFELPSLFALKENAEGKILAMDYLGMLVASVTFPLLFLPYLGTAASTLLVALLNGAALIWLRAEVPKKILTAVFSIVIIGLITLVMLSRSPLNDFLSGLYLGGKP